MLRDIRFLLKTRYSGSRALVIGIDRYVHGSPLSYAVNDAEGICHALVNDLKFPAENVTLLKDEGATKEKILRAYLSFTKNEIGVDDRIILFFAGHGLTKTGMRGEVGYLVPHDGDSDDLSTLIRWEELTKNADLVRAKHMVFIMDVCYGGLALSRSLGPGSTRFLKDMLLRYARQVITAGKADEVVADSGGPLANHSVFTGHLLEGLRGKAFSEDGILTANGLMSYVHGKVARDHNSNQTPHYGYFDGDGDVILHAPQLGALEADENKDIDTLLVVPYEIDEPIEGSAQSKVEKVKTLLGSDGTAIELHDFLVGEVRQFLAGTGEDQFKMQGNISPETLADRIAKYEALVNDLSLVIACLAYWARPMHKPLLQKVLSRSVDGFDVRSGISTWLDLRWFPIIVELYCSGIAAVAGGRLDSLAAIFHAPVGSSVYQRDERFFVEAVAEAMLELVRGDVFKQLPGHKQQYTPLSEYLFKILQPGLDDLLFLGKSYERVFDEFEAILALVVADMRTQKGQSAWGPIGRFGWKSSSLSQARYGEAPLPRLMAEATEMGEAWGLLKAGFFGGSLERFKKIASEFSGRVAGLNWY